jgi:hypothetical protein
MWNTSIGKMEECFHYELGPGRPCEGKNLKPSNCIQAVYLGPLARAPAGRWPRARLGVQG